MGSCQESIFKICFKKIEEESVTRRKKAWSTVRGKNRIGLRRKVTGATPAIMANGIHMSVAVVSKYVELQDLDDNFLGGCGRNL